MFKNNLNLILLLIGTIVLLGISIYVGSQVEVVSTIEGEKTEMLYPVQTALITTFLFLPCLVASVIMMSNLLHRKNQFASDIESYNALKALLDNSCIDPNFMEIKRVNDVIGKHKSYYKSIWCGVNYSKEIADLKYLE